MTGRISANPSPVADPLPPAARVREREREPQRGSPRGRKAGKRAFRDEPLVGPRPRHVGSGPCRCRSGRGLVDQFGRWVSGLQFDSRFLCSEVGGTRERPAHLCRPARRSPAPRSVGSPHALRPAARSGREPPPAHCLGKETHILEPPGVNMGPERGPSATTGTLLLFD